MTNLTPAQVLDLPMGANDADATTIRGYLVQLLAVLWHHGEGFSGKRPFGNSSWQWELYKPLVKAGAVPGALDEDGYLDDLPDGAEDTADALIAQAIRELDATRTPADLTREADSCEALADDHRAQWAALLERAGMLRLRAAADPCGPGVGAARTTDHTDHEEGTR
jgi:hypothetical protein